MTTDSSLSGRAPRGPGPIRQLARLFLVQLLAVIAVAAVIAVVFTAAGRGTGRLPADAGSSGAGAAASTTATTTTTATPATTTPGSAAATTAAPPASAVPPSAATVPPPSPSSAPSTSAGNDRPKVDVLNQSSPGGTAAHTADDVRTVGWRVGRIDNFVGNVRATTVYYPPGLQTQAKDLAEALPGSQRVLPGFSTLSTTRLSLILVR